MVWTITIPLDAVFWFFWSLAFACAVILHIQPARLFRR